MEKQNIQDADILRQYSAKISMHPSCAPTETVAGWYAMLFGKFPSVKQLHYDEKNLNDDTDVRRYLDTHLPKGFTLLTIQSADRYEQPEGERRTPDHMFFGDMGGEYGVVGSTHTNETCTYADYSTEILVFSMDELLLAAYDVANEEACTRVLAIFAEFKAKCLHKRIKQKHIGLLTTSEFGGFEITNTQVKDTSNLDLQGYYNDDFAPIAENITRFVNGDDSGLVILHGEQGTGKTSFIRHLINTCDRQFVYLPMNIATQLSSPALVKFLQKELTNAVVIIEDCEQLLEDRRNSPFNIGIANILNLADGLLGDSLRIRILCTFNSDVQRIDRALLRKGRLVDMYEFGRLSADKTGRLLHNLYGKDAPAEAKPMTLAEIFNYNTDNHAFRSLQPSTVGFAM